MMLDCFSGISHKSHSMTSSRRQAHSPQAKKPKGNPPHPESEVRNPSQNWLIPLLAPLLLLLAGLLAYGNSFHGVFLLDDMAHIRMNESIRDLSDLPSVLNGSRRPLVNLSLAINNQCSTLKSEPSQWPDSFGFHLFNITIHLLAGLTLFGIIHRGIRLLEHPISIHARWIAFTAALFWILHPLNTQAVNYVVQRGESMMGLFYLLTLYGFIRSVKSRRPPVWLTCSVVAASLGMLCKAVMVTVPITILLFDRCFVAKSFATALRRRGVYYAILFATWFLLIWPTGVATGVLNPNIDGPATVGFSFKDITPIEYLLTQGGVILNYLHLAFWPDALVLDYGWPVAHSMSEILPGTLIISLLGLLTLWLLWKHPRIGFIGAWFFIILAPTSSFVPIKDIAFEHRMYLPLATITTLITLGGVALLSLLSRKGILHPSAIRALAASLILVPGMAFAARTLSRNNDYSSGIRMWESVVRVRPQNLRAYAQLGAHHIQAGQTHKNEALKVLKRGMDVIRQGDFPPDDVVVGSIHNNLATIYRLQGNMLQSRGDYAGAEVQYREESLLTPDNAQSHFRHGLMLNRLGRHEEAITAFHKTIELTPDDDAAHYNMGNALRKLGRMEDAAIAYRQAITHNPNHARAYTNLGYTMGQLGQIDEAIAFFQTALSIQPNLAPARNGLSSLLQQQRESRP